MPYAAQTLGQIKRRLHPKKDYRPSARRKCYNTKRWYHFRLAIFQRDEYICQSCHMVTVPKHVDARWWPHCDHIKPHHNIPELMWDQRNAQTLCGSCHSRKTAKNDGGYGHG